VEESVRNELEGKKKRKLMGEKCEFKVCTISNILFVT
jgi:hypothetical protein